MKLILLCFCLTLLVPMAVMAGGSATSYRLAGGPVLVANTQANSSWATVAVLVRFYTPTNGTVIIRRSSQGTLYTLARCTFDGVTDLVWVADRDFVFSFGDALIIESTATNGVVQVMRKDD